MGLFSGSPDKLTVTTPTVSDESVPIAFTEPTTANDLTGIMDRLSNGTSTNGHNLKLTKRTDQERQKDIAESKVYQITLAMRFIKSNVDLICMGFFGFFCIGIGWALCAIYGSYNGPDRWQLAVDFVKLLVTFTLSVIFAIARTYMPPGVISRDCIMSGGKKEVDSSYRTLTK
jgi:hypothetical protein